MSQAVLEAQASFVTPEATDQEASSERCSLHDGDVVNFEVARCSWCFFDVKLLSSDYLIVLVVVFTN